MSGILFQLNTDGSEVNRKIFNKMFAEIEFRGEDGSNTEFMGNAAFGCHHFWTTPEDKGVIQPVKSNNNILLLFDGRIDNREDLINEIGIDNINSLSISDERLILKAFEKWGENCFKKFIGSFAFILYFPATRKVLAVRDQVGDRTLFYYNDKNKLIIASEPVTIVAHPGIPRKINERKLVEYFSAKDPVENNSFFQNVYEIFPSHYLINSGNVLTAKKYWHFDLKEKIHYKTDRDYTEHFLEVFEKSVKSKLRTIDTPGVMMSGGLDSTSIAAIASKHLNQKLKTFSYVFEKFSECDESGYIDEFCKIYDVESFRLNGDKYIPIVDVHNSSISPNYPSQDMYQLLKNDLYLQAANSNTRTLLTGWYADELFIGSDFWLKDSIRNFEILRGYKILNSVMKEKGWKNFHKNKAVRIVFGRLRTIKNIFNKNIPVNTTDFLTTKAKSMLDKSKFWDEHLADEERFIQIKYVLGLNNAFDASVSKNREGGVNIDFRYPFRDLRLIDFFLRIPAYQLFENNKYKNKYILKNAIKDKLPPKILEREKITGFTILLEKTFSIIKNDIFSEIQNNFDVLSVYIEKNVLLDIVNKEFAEYKGYEYILLWNIYTYIKWKKAILN